MRTVQRTTALAGLLVAGMLTLSFEIPITPWLSQPTPVSADTPSTLGYQFSFIVPPNVNAATVYIYVSSTESGTGTWKIGSGATTPFSLTANTATTLNLGNSTLKSAQNNDDTVVAGKTITIATDVPASVYADNNNATTSDATVILPNAYLGTEYMLLSVQGDGTPRFSIVAIEDGTTVTITPKATLGTRSAGVPYSVSLSAGGSYTKSGPASTDLTGTVITSSKPVAVFSSNDCMNGSNAFSSTYFLGASRNQRGACDALYEQVPPNDSWGKNFVLNGFADKNMGGMPTVILAKEDGTVVNVNGTTVATLDAGETYKNNYFLDSTSNAGLFISTSKAVLVGVFMRGASAYGSTNQTGDPAMAFVAPFEQNLNQYTVVNAPGNAAQLLNVAIPAAAYSSLRVDGSAPGGSWVDFTAGSTAWKLGQIETTTGSHNLRADQAFSVMVYGANSFNSYAYMGGQSLAPIALVDSVTLQTSGSYSGDVGQEVCIQVNVLDANGAALPGVRVDGSISGTNAATSLVGTSNNQGVASLCYTTASAGTDTVTLTSNGRSASTQVVWTVVAPEIAYDPNTLSVVSGSVMPTIAPTNSGSSVTSWSISPSLPSGLILDPATGVVSGTPTATIAQTNFTITALNSAGSDTAVMALEVTAAAVLPTIDYATSYSLTLDQAVTPIVPTTSGTYPSWSLSGTLPVGLSFNTQNGQISGTPTRLKSSTSFTVTATNAQGSTTDSFDIEVLASIPAISYTPNSANFVANDTISPMLPSNSGSPATSWTVSPALPAGLSFNTSTGQISGTPTATTAQTSYTITATNSAGNNSTTVLLSVVASLLAPDVSYSAASLSLTEDSAMSAVLPTNVGGAASSWSVSPSLPAGLSLNATSGRISGTPTTSQSATSYTVTATNSTGNDTFVITISVVGALAAPSIGYASSTFSLTVNTALSPLTPTNSGGTIATWSIAPSLPNGLSFDTSTGTVSGTPSSTAALTAHVVTATNATGSDTFTISIEIAAATSTTASTQQNAPSAGNTTTIATVTTTTLPASITSTTIRPRRRIPVPTVRDTTPPKSESTQTPSTSLPNSPRAPTTTVVRPVTTVTPIIVTPTTVVKPLQSATTVDQQLPTTTLSERGIQAKMDATRTNVYDLSIPVYVDGKLPDPTADNPIAIQTGQADPVNVLLVNEQVLQLSTSTTSLRVTVVDDKGQLVPVSPTGAIVVSRDNTFVISGSGWQPGTEMVAWMFSTPRKLGAIPIPKSGEYSAELSVPDGVIAGEHTVQVNGFSEEGSLRSMNMEVLYLGSTVALQEQWPVDSPIQDSRIWTLIFCVVLFALSTTWLVVGARRRRGL